MSDIDDLLTHILGLDLIDLECKIKSAKSMDLLNSLRKNFFVLKDYEPDKREVKFSLDKRKMYYNCPCGNGCPSENIHILEFMRIYIQEIQRRIPKYSNAALKDLADIAKLEMKMDSSIESSLQTRWMLRVYSLATDEIARRGMNAKEFRKEYR